MTIPDEIAVAITSAYAELGGGAVAVRSSATAEDLPGAAFAGQHDTFLNLVDEAQVLDAVRACWASLWGAVADGADVSETIRRTASVALEAWRRPIVTALMDMGATRERADSLSTLMLCTLEGAIILARAHQSTEPLHTVARTLQPALTIADH